MTCRLLICLCIHAINSDMQRLYGGQSVSVSLNAYRTDCGFRRTALRNSCGIILTDVGNCQIMKQLQWHCICNRRVSEEIIYWL